MFGFFYSEKGLIFRSCVVCLCLINYPFVVADHHGPPKVACWKDPMSPSKWKEEHVSLWFCVKIYCIQFIWIFFFAMRWLDHVFGNWRCVLIFFWLVCLCLQFVIVSLTGWGLLIYGGFKLATGGKGKKEEVLSIYVWIVKEYLLDNAAQTWYSHLYYWCKSFKNNSKKIIKCS